MNWFPGGEIVTTVNFHELSPLEKIKYVVEAVNIYQRLLEDGRGYRQRCVRERRNLEERFVRTERGLRVILHDAEAELKRQGKNPDQDLELVASYARERLEFYNGVYDLKS